jgi:hypothetical protein
MFTTTAFLACSMLASSFGPDLERMPQLPDVAPPPMGEAQWVAERMAMNGLPMSLKAFSAPMSIDALFQFYESWGRTRGIKDAMRSRRGDWHVLALKSTRHFISIQARHTVRGSEGTIAVSSVLDSERPSVSTEFPHPANVRVVSLQQYWDGDLESEHISMISFRAVAVEARAFAEALTRHGWRVMRDGPGSAHVRSHVIEAQRGAQHVMMTLQPDQTRHTTTVIVAVWRKR